MAELDCTVLTHSNMGFWGNLMFPDDPELGDGTWLSYADSFQVRVMPEESVDLVDPAMKGISGGSGAPFICVPVFILPDVGESPRVVYCQFFRDTGFNWFFGLFPEFDISSFIGRAPVRWPGYLSMNLYSARRQRHLFRAAVYGTDKEYEACLKTFSEDPILRYVEETYLTMRTIVRDRMITCRTTSTKG